MYLLLKLFVNLRILKIVVKTLVRLKLECFFIKLLNYNRKNVYINFSYKTIIKKYLKFFR